MRVSGASTTVLQFEGANGDGGKKLVHCIILGKSGLDGGMIT
jgi:hypothetical protein